MWSSVFIILFSIDILHTSTCANAIKEKIKIRAKGLCNGQCFSKCCSIGYVYSLTPENPRLCIPKNDSMHSIVDGTQPIYYQNRIVDKENLTEKFQILEGSTCRRKYKLDNGYYLQRVSEKFI